MSYSYSTGDIPKERRSKWDGNPDFWGDVVFENYLSQYQESLKEKLEEEASGQLRFKMTKEE